MAATTVVLSLEAVNLMAQLAAELTKLAGTPGSELSTVVADVAADTQAASAAALGVVGAPVVDVPTVVSSVVVPAQRVARAVLPVAAPVCAPGAVSSTGGPVPVMAPVNASEGAVAAPVVVAPVAPGSTAAALGK
jgi:hypothetical protein